MTASLNELKEEIEKLKKEIDLLSYIVGLNKAPPLSEEELYLVKSLAENLYAGKEENAEPLYLLLRRCTAENITRMKKKGIWGIVNKALPLLTTLLPPENASALSIVLARLSAAISPTIDDPINFSLELIRRLREKPQKKNIKTLLIEATKEWDAGGNEELLIKRLENILNKLSAKRDRKR